MPSDDRASVSTGDRWLLRHYARCLHLRSRIRAASDGVFDGLWLGLLRRNEVHALGQAFFESASERVDGVDRRYTERSHITQGLSDWEKAAVTNFEAGGRVLVTSAGAGREIVALRQLGFDAFGFEPVWALVEAGRTVLSDPSLLRGSDYDVFPTVNEEVDAIIIGWGAYMLVQGSDTRIELLRDARAALRQGGLVLLSYFHRYPSRYFTVVRGVGSAVRRLRGDAPVELGDALSPNFVHYFTEDEVRREIEAAGLEVVTTAAAPYGHALARRP